MDDNSSAISKIRRSREEAIDENDEFLMDDPMDESVPMFVNPSTSLSVPFQAVMPAGSIRRTTTQRQFLVQAHSRKRPMRSAVIFANNGNGDEPDDDTDMPRGLFMNQQTTDAQLNAEYRRMKRENEELRIKAVKLEDRLTDLQTKAKESYDEQVKQLTKINEQNQAENEQKIATLQKKHEADLNATKEQAAELASKNNDLTKEVKRLTKENTDLRTEIEKLRIENEQLRKEINRLNKAIQGLIVRIKNAEDAAIENDIKYKKQKLAHDTLKKNVDDEAIRRKNLIIQGEVAFRLDRAIIHYVFTDRFGSSDNAQRKKWERTAQRLTFSDLVYRNFELKEETETKRFNEILHILQNHSWSDNGTFFAKMLTDLKANRRDTAHLTDQERTVQTRDMLKEAARRPTDEIFDEVEYENYLLDYEDVVDILCDITGSERPLEKRQ